MKLENVNEITGTPKVLLRGINLWLTEAMRETIMTKAERLLRHEPDVMRIRIDVDEQLRGRRRAFAARGHLELEGPDLHATVTTDDAYKSVDLLIDKLDRQLRKRATAQLRRRTGGDIRLHEAPAF